MEQLKNQNMVQIQIGIARKVAEKEINKINNQPMNQCNDLLEQELNVIAASTRSPQANSRHKGILMEDTDYVAAFRVAIPFTTPNNPSMYPAGPFPN